MLTFHPFASFSFFPVSFLYRLISLFNSSQRQKYLFGQMKSSTKIIKIEEPTKGDAARSMGPHIQGVSSYFLSINRGSRSIALNLQEARAKEVVFKLIDRVDIVVEIFRPGVMKRLGFGYDAVSARNPKIIYAAISGFGQKGPYASLSDYQKRT
jgi:crotonobetainyl-CoA:carnitine CoA-transferase CaiB-like acyl-CoA transferase